MGCSTEKKRFLLRLLYFYELWGIEKEFCLDAVLDYMSCFTHTVVKKCLLCGFNGLNIRFLGGFVLPVYIPDNL